MTLLMYVRSMEYFQLLQLERTRLVSNWRYANNQGRQQEEIELTHHPAAHLNLIATAALAPEATRHYSPPGSEFARLLPG